MKFKKVLTISLLVLQLSIPILVSAAIIPNAPTSLGSFLGDQNASFNSIVRFIINLALSVVGIISVVFLIYGGFRYVTSGGNEEASTQAKKIIANAVLGLIIVLLSYVIIVVISRALITGQT